MKDEGETYGTLALMCEVGIVIILCMIIIVRLPQHSARGTNDSETVTEIPTERASLTETCTIAPTDTPSPSPTAVPPSPTEMPQLEVRATVAGCTIKQVGKGHQWKPYTRYTSYNVPSSQQYKLQKIAKTAENGIRVVTDPDGVDRYCVALGTYWAGGQPEHIGRCVDVYMYNGAVLHCVLADVKKDEHSLGGKRQYGAHGEVLEFIVDGKAISADVKNYGNVSKAGPEFAGDVEQMVIMDMWIEGFGK